MSDQIRDNADPGYFLDVSDIGTFDVPYDTVIAGLGIDPATAERYRRIGILPMRARRLDMIAIAAGAYDDYLDDWRKDSEAEDERR